MKKSFTIYIVIATFVTFGAITIGNLTIKGYKISKAYIKADDIAETLHLTPINVARAKEPSMKEWIKKEIENAGIKWKEAEKIIMCESNFNPDAHAVNWNNMKGVDRGLWQISSLYHKDVSNKCAYDYKCATKEAIRIYKSWGGWGAWSCSRKVM